VVVFGDGVAQDKLSRVVAGGREFERDEAGLGVAELPGQPQPVSGLAGGDGAVSATVRPARLSAAMRSCTWVSPGSLVGIAVAASRQLGLEDAPPDGVAEDVESFRDSRLARRYCGSQQLPSNFPAQCQREPSF
jgi:hypothetical protein